LKTIGLIADAGTLAYPPAGAVLQPIGAVADVGVALIKEDGKELIPLVASELAGRWMKWLDAGVNVGKYFITRFQVTVNQALQNAQPPQVSQ
jgi:hypothetical protein